MSGYVLQYVNTSGINSLQFQDFFVLKSTSYPFLHKVWQNSISMQKVQKKKKFKSFWRMNSIEFEFSLLLSAEKPFI